MKTLRYLLIICTLTMAAAMFGQAQFKTAENKKAFDNSLNKTHFEFYSTSTLKGSGSSLPIAARSGFTVGANTPDDNSSSGGARGPRRGKKDEDPFGDETIGGIDKPNEPGTPIGDGMWMLLMMAAGYAVYRKRKMMHAESIG